MKTLTQLVQLVDLHWKPNTPFDLKITYESGEVMVKVGASNCIGVGATVQDAVDDLCSARRPTTLLGAILKMHQTNIDATTIDLEAAKKAVAVAEKKLADQRVALERLKHGVDVEQK